MSEKKDKPGRIVMSENVPNYRGCMSLREGTVQRLDEKATKELVESGKAETYEDHSRRKAGEKRSKESKKRAADKAAKDRAAKSKLEKKS